ncbi:gliding motility-associated C-terminal domain-containing protein [Chitinophaga rhizophila]|uniref:Gliding motility-associated C-terminal domain-containing protein n=1 Tax=Chitinophaga rhizophila TaxID=2866212 RepID=A0ABS7GKS0_9BACT|nr:gliding motility-associated C-terminal domain-containing protein [Chitinophaga rhizophila]MBW8687028.1 gliding motility-associated C-terminal domain-containing protein [Chitinophaga rhizophila]
MKKLLILLCLLLGCAFGMVQAQTVYVNVPDTVCMSTTNATANQLKFASMNARLTGNNISVTKKAVWQITTPNNTDADYEVLYSENPAADKPSKLNNTNLLTLQFLIPGTYTFRVTQAYKGADSVERTIVTTKTLIAENCTITTCGDGSATMAGFIEDFGSMADGVNRRPYPVDGVVNYTYRPNGDVPEDHYIITHNPTNAKSNWANKADHTGGYRGAMLVANSALDPRQFYTKNVTGLCAGSIYNFSAWLLNVNTVASLEGCGDYGYAGVTFKVVDANNPARVLNEFKTRSVSMMLGPRGPTWQRYGGTLVVPADVTAVNVYVINNKPGGCGNDIAIDDIEFAYCSPNIISEIDGDSESLAEVLCEGAPITLSSSYAPLDYFVDPVFEWQMSDDEGKTWLPVPFGTISANKLIIGEGELKGTRSVASDYLFRTIVYERGSDQATCASPSSEVRLTILPMPNLTLTRSQVCEGADVELEASGGFDSYAWKDLPGHSGTTRNIVVDKDTTITVIGYVNYADGHTCQDENSIFISTVRSPSVDVSVSNPRICLGESVDLKINSALAGYNIHWYRGPDAGGILDPMPEYDGMTDVSQLQISDPADTVFTVIVSDPGNVCEVRSAPIIVNTSGSVTTQLRPNTKILCASANPSGNFTIEVDRVPGARGIWAVEEMFGPAVTDDVVDNYVRILQPTAERTRVTIKKAGVSVVLSWTLASTANPNCETVVLDTLSLLTDPSYSYAGPDTTQCGTDNIFTMNASRPAPETEAYGPAAERGQWRLISGNATIDNDTAYNTTVTAHDPQGDIVLTWTITNLGGCVANVDEVVLHKIGKPVIRLASPVIACSSKGSFLLDTLSTKGTPTLYSITTATPAMPGFVAVTDQPLTWPLRVNIPATAPPGVYNFNLSYRTAKAGCDSTVPFTVNVASGPTPATSISSSTAGVCGNGTVTLQVNGGSLGLQTDGVTPNAVWAWYAGGCGAGTRIGTGATITVPLTAATTFYVRAESLGACDTTACVSTTVTFTGMPAAINAGPDQAKCNSSAFVMNATPAAPGIGAWSLPAGATIPGGQINNPAATITVNAGDTIAAVWRVTNGTCVVTDTVILINYAQPTLAAAGPDIRQCGNRLFTMAANPALVGRGVWSLPAGSTATIAAGQQNNPAAVIDVPQGTTVTATWTVTNGLCTSSDAVVLTHSVPPTTANAGNDQAQCGNDRFTMNATPVTTGTGVWTLPAGTRATITAGQTNNPAAVITVPAGTTVVATWTTTNGTCTSTDNVTLSNGLGATTAAAGPDISQCNNPRFTLAANAPVTGAGSWTVVSAPAGFTLPAGMQNNPVATITIPAAAIVVLRWTISNGGCSTSDDVTLTNSVAPNPAVAGDDQSKCNIEDFTLAANSAAGGTGRWTVISPSTYVFPPAQVANPLATIRIAAGTRLTLTWTIANGGCTTSDTIVLTNSQLPAAAAAGPDQSQCADLDFIMAANKPNVTGAIGTWSVVSGPATIAAGQANMDTAHIILPSGTTAVLRWTISNGTCTSADDISLTSIPRPTTATAGPDQQHCENALFNMAANAPVTGTAAWSIPAGSGVSIAAGDMSNPNAVITLPAGNTATIAWVISNSTCNSVDSITLTNSVMPNNADAGDSQVHCDDPDFIMNANNAAPASATGTWTIVSGTATIVNIHSATTVVNVPAGSTATLRWTISNGACTSTPDDVVLTNQPAIQGNTITTDQVLCASDVPATLSGGTITGGTGNYTYQWQMSTTNATTGFVNVTTGTGGTTPDYTPTSITRNTWFRRVVMSGACTGNISNAVMLTLMNIPPVVISVPDPITADCENGVDYTTRFGTPVFSHAPYDNEPLTITYNDVTNVLNTCTTIITRTWTATDRCGLSTQAQQVITVTDQTAPKFTSAAPAHVTVSCDAIPLPVNLTATDNCAGTMNIAPIEQRQDGSCPSNYLLVRRWVATDACGNNSDTLMQIITVRDMTPPVFNGIAPVNITVDCDKVPAGEVMTANDNCTPGMITVNPVDTRKAISGSKCADNYQIVRTWTATDLCGNRTVLTQTITVQDTIKPRFSVIVPAAITVNCDSIPGVDNVTATDNCTANVTVRLTESRQSLSTSCLSSYKLTRTWTASDACGNTATMQQVVTVQDTTRPVFAVLPPADTTVSCDAVPTAPTNLRATDNCGTVKIGYTQTRETIQGGCAGNYRLIRTWTARDLCNNTTVMRQVITVTDTTGPVIDPAPADVTISCTDAVPVPATLYAVDNCDVNFPKRVAMTQDPFVVDKCNGYTITRRWNISDACGNAATERIQTITVEPCPKPELETNMPSNCSSNTRFAVMLKNKVTRPKFVLIGVVPATAVATPLTQSSNVFDLKGATQATFAVIDGVTGCSSDTVTYDLDYILKPFVELGDDIAVCNGESVTLDVGAANAGYNIRWSTGALTPTVTVNNPGTYSVTVSNGICTTVDSIKLSVNNPPVIDMKDTTICEGTTLRLGADIPGASFVWSTGETTPFIDVYMAGRYMVDVSLNGCTTHDEIDVTVAPAPAVVLTPDTEICPDETVMLTVDPDGGSVSWNNGETGNSIVVSRPGDYWVTVTRNSCVITDTVKVTLKSHLNINIGPQREICTGGLVVLDATNTDAVSYLWNDGDTNPVKEVSQPGRYTVSVMDRFCSQITMDSVDVIVSGIPAFDLGRDTTLCLDNTLDLKVEPGIGNQVRWQDGSTANTFKVTSTGYYTVTIFNDCGSATDQIAVTFKPCEPDPSIPTAFTPNGDGKNDLFRPTVKGPMYEYQLHIYNRWGTQVYFGRDSRLGWDGRYLGELVESGSYIWVMSYKNKAGSPVIILKGQVTLLK